MEVPLEDGETTGFIDLLLFDSANNTLWILDFKPKARKEDCTKVGAQLWKYKMMLLPVIPNFYGDIRLAYFDDENCYEIVL